MTVGVPADERTQPRGGGFSSCRPAQAHAGIGSRKVRRDVIVRRRSQSSGLAHRGRCPRSAPAATASGGLADEQKMGVGCRRRERGEPRRIGSIRFSGVTCPNATNTIAVSAMPNSRRSPVSRASALRGAGQARRNAHRIGSTRTSGYWRVKVAGDADVVDGDQPGRAEDDAAASTRGSRSTRSVPRRRIPRHRAARRDGRSETRAVVVRAALAQQLRAPARGGGARRAGRPGPGRRRDTPTCSRASGRCRPGRRRDRTARAGVARRSRVR